MWRELFSLLIVTCLPSSYSNLESYFMNNFQGRQRGKGGGVFRYGKAVFSFVKYKFACV
jgi:hypothetical protein